MAIYGNMSKLWDYVQDVLEMPTKYCLGKFGQKENGKLLYDCVCLIKSYPWCNGTAGATPTYKSNGINDDWLGNLYVYADKKSTNMSELPKDGIWLVYLNNEHIGVYNATTGTVVECCAGNTMRVVERDLHHYDGTKIAWNKWSDLYWCPQSDIRNTRSTIRKFEETPSEPDDAANEPNEDTHKQVEDMLKPDKAIYERVQIGAFTVKSNAVRRAKEVIEKGYPAIIKKYGDYYRVQVGAFSEHNNAVRMKENMVKLGYTDAYITTEGGTDVSF